MLTSSPLTLPCLITWNSLVPLVVKVTTAAHVGSGRQQHELLNKTEAALKSPAVVRNDENIPNLAWIYNYAKSKFESLYWNFSIPIQSPGRELLWIICRDCVYLWESVCVIFFLPVFFFKCRSQILHNETFVESQNHNKWTFLRSIFIYELTIMTPVLYVQRGQQEKHSDFFKTNSIFISPSVAQFLLAPFPPLTNSIFTGVCKLSVNVNGSVCYYAKSSQRNTFVL